MNRKDTEYVKGITGTKVMKQKSLSIHIRLKHYKTFVQLEIIYGNKKTFKLNQKTEQTKNIQIRKKSNWNLYKYKISKIGRVANRTK